MNAKITLFSLLLILYVNSLRPVASQSTLGLEVSDEHRQPSQVHRSVSREDGEMDAGERLGHSIKTNAGGKGGKATGAGGSQSVRQPQNGNSSPSVSLTHSSLVQLVGVPLILLSFHLT